MNKDRLYLRRAKCQTEATPNNAWKSLKQYLVNNKKFLKHHLVKKKILNELFR